MKRITAMQEIFILVLFLSMLLVEGGRDRQKRAVDDFGLQIIAKALNPLDFNEYGCWCGLGGNGPSLDAIDECCHVHDLCYEAVLTKYDGAHPSLTPYSWENDGDICSDPSGTKAYETCKCDQDAAHCFKDNIGVYDAKHKNIDKKTDPKCNKGIVKGDPHHKTFDGITIDFEGPCTYIWSMYQGSVYPKFQVVARYEIHWTANWKIGELTTYYESNKITISRRWISINKKRILHLPYNDPDGSFKIKQEGKFTVFESSNGIRVGYNRKWVGFVKIPKEYHGLVDGILGDSDGDANNDLRTREGTLVENNKYGHCLIGNSWQFDSKKRCSTDCEKPLINAP